MFLHCEHRHWLWCSSWAFFSFFFLSQSRSISAGGGTGGSIELCSRSAPRFIFTFLRAELYLTVRKLSPKAGKRKKKKSHQTRLTLGQLEVNKFMKWENCFPHRCLLFNFTLKAARSFVQMSSLWYSGCFGSVIFWLCCGLLGAPRLGLSRREAELWYVASFVAQIAYITWLINQQMALVRA